MELIINAVRNVQLRGKARLLNKIGPHTGTRLCKVFGLTFTLDLSDWIQRQIYFGTFERQETKIVRKQLRPGMTFVDVGANVGYYTALAATLVGPSGRVVAFEPSPYAFRRLKQLIADNNLKHVTALNEGLSDVAGRLNLYLGIGSCNHTPTMVPHENSSGVEVAVRTLDAVAEELGISQIDFMKIDVEGHELRVLAGARRLLTERRIKNLLCEFNEHWLLQAGSSPEVLERLIASGGLVEATGRSVRRTLDNHFFSCQ